MVNEMLRRSFYGLGFAAVITFAFLTAMTIQSIDVGVEVIWKNMLGSMMIGIYFGIASLLFEIERWSPLKQTAVHFVLSIVVWLPLGIYLGWVPLDPVALFVVLVMFIAFYVIFWFAGYLYLKRIENDINQNIKK